MSSDACSWTAKEIKTCILNLLFRFNQKKIYIYYIYIYIAVTHIELGKEDLVNMGNLPSNQSGSTSRMAISAMADMMKVDRTQFIYLRGTCLQRVLSTKRNSKRNKKQYDITREEFRNAMKEINLDMNDFDVFDHLFTMHDKYGEERINLLLFLAGISPLASTLDTGTKLYFAFEVFDIDNSGCLKKIEAKKILNGINATASFFGDPVLTSNAIDVIIEDVYRDQTELFFHEYIDLFADHPAVVQFNSSGGTARFKRSEQKGNK